LSAQTDTLTPDHDGTQAPVELTPPEQPSTLRKIFIGKDGLRAGWSLLIFIAFLAALLFGVRLLAHKLLPPSPTTAQTASELPPSPRLFIAEGVPFLGVFFIGWIMSKIEHRRNSVYGFGGIRKLWNFIAGLATGVVCLSLLVLLLLKTGLVVIDARVLFGGDILRYGFVWLAMFLVVGFLEEYMTRGYLQYTLTRGLAGFYSWAFKTRHSQTLGFWTSALVLSILFGLSHGKNPGESPIGLLSAGLAGMVFCLSLWRTGSLWWAIGCHASWDWGQSFVYGVADSGLMAQHHLLATHPVGKPILSGGATGPEGSIFILAILALMSLIILSALRRGSYGESQQQDSVPLLSPVRVAP
jgi:membrane protease YdiL (CAAX protease family)